MVLCAGARVLAGTWGDADTAALQRKYKESKAEANAAQNALEKEITTLRDTNRTLQLQLRDIEVANDDFERQARNTTSSLADLDSKYSQAIERAVMLEEEMKIGEQERENLRVEAQRLREELSDLKIEAEILHDKIKKQESRHLSDISTNITVPESPTSAGSSPRSGASSPLVTTPPDTKSVSTAETVSEVQDPPSPQMAEASATLPKKPMAAKTPAPAAVKKSRLPSADHSVTPRPKQFGSSTAPRTGGGRAATSNPALRTPAARTSTAATPAASRSVRASSQKMPTSNSLSHIRSLTAQMQRLEARVHSARSKLPAPTATPPRASPLGHSVPSTVTIRSRRRAPGSVASSVAASAIDETTPTNPHSYSAAPSFSASTSSNAGGRHVPRLSTSGVSRLSFGPLPNRGPGGGTDSDMSRPSSRASVSSFARPASRADNSNNGSMPPPRPLSRTSLSGARTPLGRPRSSLSGSVHGHGHSASVSYMPITASGGGQDSGDDREIKTPSRRGTYSKFEAEAALDKTSGIPMPSSARRQSGLSGIPAPGGGASRRTSAIGTGKKLDDLGETY
jgi:hypothetical protein